MNIKNFIKRVHLSEERLDELIFENSSYKNMSFKRLDNWDDTIFDADWNKKQFVSPRFQFENGDILAVDRVGELKKLN